MLSFSAHKLMGPQGVGALILKRKLYKRPPIKGIMYGGQQEQGIRPGTIPVALVVGCGKACTSSNYSPSYVLAAMGLDGSRIEASLRLSWGPNSDLKEVVDNFKKLLYVAKLMAN